MPPQPEGWDQYRIFILATLERIDATLAALNKQLQQNTIDIRLQAFKWGLVGSIPAALAACAALYQALKP